MSDTKMCKRSILEERTMGKGTNDILDHQFQYATCIMRSNQKKLGHWHNPLLPYLFACLSLYLNSISYLIGANLEICQGRPKCSDDLPMSLIIRGCLKIFLILYFFGGNRGEGPVSVWTLPGCAFV